MALPHPSHGRAAKPRPNRPPKSSSSGLASCVVATLFLVFIIIIVLIVFFTIFRPKDPKISVTGIQLPSFSILSYNSSSFAASAPSSSPVAASNTSLVSFTFSQYIAVNNPNRASFSHYDSSLQLLYAGNQVGFMFIPAGKISPGHTQYMAASFAVQSFPLSFSPSSSDSIGDGVYGNGIYSNLPGGFGNNVGGSGSIPGYYGGRVRPTLEIQSMMKLGGRVRVLHFFIHHVAVTADCRVTIAIADGFIDDACGRGILVVILTAYSKCGEKVARSIIERLGETRTSRIKIVNWKKVEQSLYGQLVLGKGMLSGLNEQLSKEVRMAASAEKQRIAEEVASLLKLRVELDTRSPERYD